MKKLFNKNASWTNIAAFTLIVSFITFNTLAILNIMTNLMLFFVFLGLSAGIYLLATTIKNA